MIHKGDILVHRVNTDKTKGHLMLALEEEIIYGQGVRTKELNDWVSTERIVTASETKVIGHAEPGEGVADIVKRCLPEGLWQYTPALYRQNVMKNKTRLTAGRPKKSGGIVLINERTGERKDMDSITEAAKFLNSTFSSVQTAALKNSVRDGWKMYEDAETIRKRIKSLKAQLAIVDS